MASRHLYFLSPYTFDVFACTKCGKLIKVIYPHFPDIQVYKYMPLCACEKPVYVELTYLNILWNGEN